jgi:hypothetical protein
MVIIAKFANTQKPILKAMNVDKSEENVLKEFLVLNPKYVDHEKDLKDVQAHDINNLREKIKNNQIEYKTAK